MRIKKVKDEGGTGGAKWLTTFNDLMTLLMVFFVLLFTMGSVDTKRLKSFQGSLQSGLGILKEGQKVDIKFIGPPPTSDHGKQKEMVEELEEMLGESIKSLDSEPGILTVHTKEGVVIRLQDSILFASGSADINLKAFTVLEEIAKIIKEFPHPVRIEGHTDNDPIHTEKFASNWELSTARSVNVVKFFIDKGKIPPVRLSAVGYGETRPLFSADTLEHKVKNRRVEIILVEEEK